MSINPKHETRIELATENGRRKPIRRSVKMPGAAGHVTSDESAETIARRIQLAKMEKRVARRK